MKAISTTLLGLLLGAFSVHAGSAGIDSTAVNALVDPYLAIQKSLAADDLAVAKTSAGTFVEVVAAHTHENAEAPAVKKLTEAVQQIHQTDDIESARSGFLILSNEMIALVKSEGPSAEQTLFIANCPMAFDNEGGKWIQDSENIANPYFGASMFRCGEIVEEIAAKEGDSHADHGCHCH